MSKKVWMTHTTWCATGARQTDTLDDVKKGEGKIVRLHGRKHAAYRDDAGHVTVCSPVCTPLHCLVRWNTADHIWDWPCHGLALPRDRCCAAWAGWRRFWPVDLAALQA